MAITLSLAVCRIIYNLHFGVDMPDTMTFQSAANKVFAQVTPVEFDKLCNRAIAIEPDYVEFDLLTAIAMHADTSPDHINSDLEKE